MVTGNYAVTVTPEFETDQKGRNPELTGMHHDVYMFVKDNPACTRRDVAKALGLRSSSATARVKELIDRGLLMEHGTTVDSLTKKTVRCLYAPTDYQHKKPRDRVLVRVQLIVDEAGNYHATAHVVGGKTVAVELRRHVVMDKELTLIAPYPNEYRSMFVKEKLSKVEPRDTLANSKLIIDG